ncbi:DUF6495 family protein [Marinoscillum sp. MHG1-6]|uniref:DUF6495 family protein n=1 Tax=Marinoscillum sp. MHG1-6 TaxID=2959627 RepID=UPI0021587CE0|nr:DUF6495 family protein [Marinoscillum sp. MHG1-6]
MSPLEPKYRILTQSELQELEKEFVDFLVVNGITADQWVKIKEEDKSKAEDMITLFSDVVLEGVLRQVKFLEIRTKDDVKTFQCLDDKMVLVGMMTADPSADFCDDQFLSQSLAKPPKGIKVYTTEKAYNSDRQEELFQMINNGCEIADGRLFKALSLAMASK